MSVAFDGAANSGYQTVASYNYNHAFAGPLINGALCVFVHIDDITVSVSQVGVDGAPATFVAAQNPPGSFGRTELWVKTLGSAAVGRNINITLSGATNSIAGSISFNSVRQSQPLGTAVKASGTGTAVSATVADGDTASFIIDGVTISLNFSETYTVDASQSQRWNVFTDGQIRGVGSTELGASSVTMSGTISASLPWSQVAIAVLPALDLPQRRTSRIGGLQLLASDEDDGHFNDLDVRNWFRQRVFA
jgi:hypothetical protein